MIPTDDEYEFFCMMVLIFIVMYVIFIIAVSVTEHILYKRDCKKFDKQHNDKH